MKLTEHFTLEELIASDTAKARGIQNEPTSNAIAFLRLLAENVLEPARVMFGSPIKITSGYRCPKLNSVVGGKKNSQHLRGQAADLQVSNPSQLHTLYEIIKAQDNFDQLLFEKSKSAVWIHVSYNPINNRHQAIDNYQA